MTVHNLAGVQFLEKQGFEVTYLDVDEKQSAFRLYNRNIDSYQNKNNDIWMFFLHFYVPLFST